MAAQIAGKEIYIFKIFSKTITKKTRLNTTIFLWSEIFSHFCLNLSKKTIYSLFCDNCWYQFCFVVQLGEKLVTIKDQSKFYILTSF